MTQNRYYSSTAVRTSLTVGVNASATTLSVTSTSGFPASFPYTLLLDVDETTEEAVDVTARVGLNLTVTRGVAGTTAQSHSVGAVVAHGLTHRDLDEPQAHMAASSGVHGAVGTIVGTTDTQVLTNKTLTTPTIGDFSLAQHTHASSGQAGALSFGAVTAQTTAGASSSNGVGTVPARNDHTHGTPADPNTFVRKTATESVTNSTTLQDDDVLTLAVAANSTYLVDLFMIYDGDTTASTNGDIKVGFTAPASAALFGSGIGVGPAGTTSSDDVTAYVVLGTANNFGTNAAGTNFVLRIQGVLTTAGTAGSLTVQWAQVAVSATATRVFANSYLNLRKVA